MLEKSYQLPVKKSDSLTTTAILRCVSAESTFSYAPAKPVEEAWSPYRPEINNSTSKDDYQIPVFTLPKSPPAPITHVVSGKTSWAELYNQPYSDQLLTSTCYAFGFDIQDHRSNGGSIWVNIGNSNSERNRVFTNWGFKYKATKDNRLEFHGDRFDFDSPTKIAWFRDHPFIQFHL